ncbi:MAG: hypothetical protein ABIE94_02560 [archaeon]
MAIVLLLNKTEESVSDINDLSEWLRSQGQHEPEFITTDSFFLDSILDSREATGFKSNSEVPDEDVNVYLIALLNSFMNPDYMERMANLVKPHDAAIMEEVLKPGTTAREKRDLYKANADFLLMQASVFREQPRGRASLPQTEDEHRRSLIGRASTYYALASNYEMNRRGGFRGEIEIIVFNGKKTEKRVYKQPAALADTLNRLADYTGKYAAALEHMASRHFGLIDRYSPGELFHLDREIEEVTKEVEKEIAGDRFLDAYSRAIKSKAPPDGRMIEDVAKSGDLLTRLGCKGYPDTYEKAAILIEQARQPRKQILIYQ